MMFSIRKFLTFSALAYLFLLVGALAVVRMNDRDTNQAMVTDAAAEQVADSALGLLLLNSEALHSSTPRIAEQWKRKVASMLADIDRIQTINHIDRPIIVRLRAAVVDVDQEMVKFFAQDMSRNQAEQMTFNISVKLHRLSALSNSLSQVARIEISRSIERTNLVIGGLATAFLVVTLGKLVFIRFFVSRPISAVTEALERIRGGHPEARIPDVPSAEFQLIGHAVNDTFDRLRSMTVSRDSLIKEVEERERAEATAIDALEKLRETQERMVHTEKLSALGTFVGGVAHEMNNPLMGITNYLDFAERHMEDGKPREMIGRAKEETERMIRIVRNMLIYARSAPSASARCDIDTVVQRVLDVLQGRTRKEDVAIETAIDPDLPEVAISADSLQQVVMNLATNAYDAMADCDRRALRVTGRRTDGQIELVVCDSGTGIPDELRTKVFDPFFTTKPAGKGTGLGLSISAQLVNDAGGSMSIANGGELGGAEFVIELPVASDQEEENNNG